MASGAKASADNWKFDTVSNGLSIQLRLPGFTYNTGRL